MTKAYELFSLLTPPAYIAFVLARKGRGHLSVNRFLRATWVGSAVGEISQSSRVACGLSPRRMCRGWWI